MDLTPDQIEKLKSLGIETNVRVDRCVDPTPPPTEKPPEIISPQPNIKEIPISNKKSVLPLLSISGLTLLSFGGMILFKSKNTASVTPSPEIRDLKSDNLPSPTQVPKSIQHYLLASQQYFSSALQMQSTNTLPKPTGEGGSESSQTQMVELLNQSILAATEAIKEFPSDYRGYQQRGKIYQSLIDSQPQLIAQAITDLTLAQKYNPSSPEITHDLASLFAKKGDSQNTLIYLAKTVALEPTKAQNFYDLAKIQQQAGLIPDALNTYNRLLPLITDPTQKTQIESEKTALENLMAQNPNAKYGQTDVSVPSSPSSPPDPINLPDNPPTIQATDITNDTGLIIAAPETSKGIEVQNKTDSNSFSGNVVLPANQKEVTINNSNLTPTSQIYTTITNGSKDQVLKIISRSESSFIVGFDTPISQDTEFKWWIINK